MTHYNKIAAVQMASSPNLGANLLEAEKLISEAAGHGANMVVLPENFAYIGEKDVMLLELAEADGDGQLQNFLSQLAERLNIWLVGGTIPLKTKNAKKIRSACLLYNDKGERVARYDKVHLFDVHLVETGERYQESATIEPGDGAIVVDTPFGKLGILICYDLRFPEQFRSLSEKGAEIFVLPSAFTAITGQAHWEPLIRARAIENLSYVVAAAQGGYHKSGRETHGHSMIVSPWGQIMGELQKGSGSVIRELDLEYLHSIRKNFPALEHRRIICG